MSFADGVETSGNFYLVPEGTSDPNIASNSGSVALTELVPAYKAEFVSNQTTISAFFNGAVINTNYAKISFTSGNPKKVGGSFTFENDRVIYTHNEEWPANTKIAGSISELRDYFGKTIASIPFEFTTTTNIVKSVSPENNATKVEVDTPIVITFNTKMNTNQKLVDLIKVVDNTGKSLTLNTNQFSWNTSSDKNDVLTIKSIALQPDNSYTIQLSENLLDKDGNKLQGTRDFSFSTRGAVCLELDTSNSFYAKSDLKFKICGDGTITDVSKAVISFSDKSIKGKLSLNKNYIVFKLDDGQKWAVGKDVTGSISGLKDKYNINISQYDFQFYVDYFEGKGTEESPYLVKDAEDLNNVRYVFNGSYFKQTQDIDLSAYGKNYVDEDNNVIGWQPIEGYEHSAWIGNYDGDGHIITNLYVNYPSYNGGIFSEVNGNIKNLGIQVDNVIYVGDNGGAIAKCVQYGGIIENCWVKGSGKVIANCCGAIVYSLNNNGTMKNCYSDIEVEGDEVGGLVADCWEAKIENSYSLGKVVQKGSSGMGKAGGLIGQVYKSSIFNCFSKSEVIAESSNGFVDWNSIGGLIGELHKSVIKNSYFAGKIKYLKIDDANNPLFSMGGLIGISGEKSSIINCYSKSDIENYSGHIGGLVGDDNSGYYSGNNSITNCYAGCSTITSETGDMYRIINPISHGDSFATTITNCYANKNMKLIKNGVTSQPGLQNPLPDTVALDGVDGANLPDNPDWKNKIFKDGYENGESFDDVWEIGNSGLPILKNMPGNPEQ